MSQRQKDGSPQAEKVPQVLQLVLQQCSDLSTPRNICSLLQVSSACRQAVQQGRVECVIDSAYIQSLRTAAGLSSFALWLPEHRGLVSVLDLQELTESEPKIISIMQTVLALAFKACAGASTARQGYPAVGAPHAADGASAVAPPQLQLVRFSADRLASPAVLSALAGIHVRKLCLGLQPAQLTPALCAALTGLSSLQQADVRCDDQATGGSAIMQRLLMSLGRLPQLGSLNVSPFLDSDIPYLPASLTALSAVLSWPTAHAAALEQLAVPAAVALDLARLTALQRLSVSTASDRLMQVQLPPQVTNLTWVGRVRVSNFGGLVEAHAYLGKGNGLAFLRDLSTHLQFRVLRICVFFGVDVDPALSALQACTSVTRLEVDCPFHICPAADAPWCNHIAKLTQLVRLKLRLGRQEPRHLLQLSALARLTHLQLSCREGWDDVVAVALACKLVNLRCLHCLVDTVAPIPVIGNLTGLIELSLSASHGSSVVSARFTPCILDQLLPLT